MTSQTTIAELCQRALAGMTAGPKPLLPALEFYAAQEGGFPAAPEGALVEALQTRDAAVLRVWQQRLIAWDLAEGASWAAGTRPATTERRRRIHALLKADPALHKALDAAIPGEGDGLGVLIEESDAERNWYTAELEQDRSYYWTHLQAYLRRSRGMDEQALGIMSAATRRIVRRLDDPSARVPRPARGLVVGYVQSGKTTNFTGVMARAIDGGYRLIIVLSGTTNLLRNQTQRRLDMEIVGVENILRGADPAEAEHEYRTDPDWPHRFTSYGKQPSLLDQVDILRLTGQEDFDSAGVGLNPLEFEFEKRDRRKPLYRRENLDHAGARLIVVKKQKDRLNRLIGVSPSIRGVVRGRT